VSKYFIDKNVTECCGYPPESRERAVKAQQSFYAFFCLARLTSWRSRSCSGLSIGCARPYKRSRRLESVTQCSTSSRSNSCPNTV